MAQLHRETFDRFVIETGKRISDLRAEAAKFRVQRNNARAEVAELRAELDSLLAEVGK